MSDYEDKFLGPVFPTRQGTAQGGSTERQMIDSTQGAAGIRTKMRLEADGTEIMLRTRAGMPEFTTKKPDDGYPEGYPRTLCAYPSDVKNSLSWSKPCVLVWDETHQKWVVDFYNPPQTRKSIPSLPETNPDFKVSYWVSASGDVSLCCDKFLFYGKKHKGGAYTSFSTGEASSSNIGIPFLGEATVGTTSYSKFIASPQKLLSDDDVVLFDHSHERDYGGTTGVKPFNIDIPPSITNDASAIALQSAVATKWRNIGPGNYDVDPHKYYWLSRILLPDVTVVSEEVVLTTYGVTDVVHNGKSGVDDELGDALTMQTDIAYFDLSRGGGSIVGFLACRPTNGEGSVIDAYNPIYYVPKHNTFTITTSPFEPWFLWKTHQFREDTFKLPINTTTKIGAIAKGSSLSDVNIRTTVSLDMKVRADGFSYHAEADTVNGELWDLYNIGFFRGNTADESVVRRVSNTTDDSIIVAVSCGGREIVLFEHQAQGAAAASATNRQAISGFSIKSGRMVWFEGEEGSIDKARFFGNNDIRACTPPLDNPYPGDPIGSEYQGYESVASWADYYNPKYDGLWHPDDSFSPYTGKASFTGKSRTIVAFDPSLNFAAYVETEVSSETAFTSSGTSWFVSSNSAQLTTVHRVKVSFVVLYKEATATTQLVSYACTKPGPWDIQVIEDWLQWPWTNTNPGPMNIIGAPRLFPDVSKFSQTDNVFMHQGVNSSLAGIPESEDENIPDGQVIFAKRFRIKDVGADWILNDYLVTEGKRGATESPEADRYYYCPDLKKLIEEDYYQVEFDQTGLRAWVGDIPSKTTIYVADKENRDAVCYRV